MIVIGTKLNRIPTKCNECLYSCLVSNMGEQKRFCAVTVRNGLRRFCPVRLINGHWQYIKPDWCPIRKI